MTRYPISEVVAGRRSPRGQRALSVLGYAAFLGILLGGACVFGQSPTSEPEQNQPPPVPEPEHNQPLYVDASHVAYFYYTNDARVEVFLVGGSQISVDKAWWARNMPPVPDAEPSTPAPSFTMPSASAPAPGSASDEHMQPRAPEKTMPAFPLSPFVRCGRYFVGDNTWALSYVVDGKRYVLFDGTDRFLALEGKEAEDFGSFVESVVYGRRTVWSGWGTALFRALSRKGGAMYLNYRCVTHVVPELSGAWSMHLTGQRSVKLGAAEAAVAPAKVAPAPQAAPPPPRAGDLVPPPPAPVDSFPRLKP